MQQFDRPIWFLRKAHCGWLLLGVFACCSGCRVSAVGNNVDGVRQFQYGNHTGAIEQFQRALANDPNSADAYYNLGAVYHNLGRRSSDQSLMQQAEGLYHQCLDRDPDHVDCYRGLAVLLVQTNRSKSAFTLVERWAMRGGDRAEPKIELARLYEEFGDPDKASQQLRDAIEVEPQNSRAWVALANLREKKGEYAQALANYRQAYDLNENLPGVATRIARLQRELSVDSVPLSQGGTRVVNTPGDPRR